MKKLLLTLAAVVLGFTAATAQTTWDFVANTYGMTRLSGQTSDYNADPLTITNGTSKIEATGSTRLWADGFRVYKDSQFTISMSGATISKIELYGAKGTSLLTASASIALSDNQPGSYAAGTWTGAATSVSFKYTATKSNQAIGKIVVTTDGGGSVVVKNNAEMSFPEATYTVKFGDAFNAPKVNMATDAVPVYSSDKEAVATVNPATGDVTIVGVGTAIITATCAETDDYYAGTAKYTLTVIDPNAPVPTDATFVFTKAGAYGLNDVLTTNKLSISEGIVNLGIEIKSGSGYRIFNSTTGYELRIQAGKDGASAGNLTISVPENYLISSIEFDGEAVGVFTFPVGTTYTVSNKIGTWSPENGKYNTVTATINKQAKVRTIKVSYVELKPAKEPVVSHNKNQVTITHEEVGAKIYYTVDGSDVDVANATLYKAPFAITETTTVKAVAVVEGKANSAQHVYVAEYIAAPTATWESVNTEGHHTFGVLDAPTMNLDGIHGGMLITITAPKGCALWYSLTQGESNPITKAPAMYANVDNDFTAVNVPLTKVESGKVENVLVQKQGKLTYYTENADRKQSHDVVVNFTGETGVEDIIADENNGEVEFFNLQGVRVANPENGVYIRRQGNKATKVLVK